MRYKYTLLPLSIVYLIFLVGCAFISNNPADAAKNAASAGKTDDQINTFKVIAEYPWTKGTIVAYQIESPALLPNMQKIATGFAAIDQSNRVLAVSEQLRSEGPSPVDIETNISQNATNYPITMISGKIYIDNVDKVEVVFEDGVPYSINPVDKTYAIVVNSILEPCMVRAYNNDIIIKEMDIPSISNTCK